ncbi:RHS repeat-associated core domain-containing protein [Lysinibacillus sp. NPDC093190]|uniref:RHS repeat-associated core domain-containing protein n=1 Tax=Lysinibacillus sp. NPDC093190 TaxID=3390575 RepID=UPI003D0312B4
MYGKVRELTGEQDFIPFRFPGQYHDFETGLYYNRFRYYDQKWVCTPNKTRLD